MVQVDRVDSPTLQPQILQLPKWKKHPQVFRLVQELDIPLPPHKLQPRVGPNQLPRIRSINAVRKSEFPKPSTRELKQVQTVQVVRFIPRQVEVANMDTVLCENIRSNVPKPAEGTSVGRAEVFLGSVIRVGASVPEERGEGGVEESVDGESSNEVLWFEEPDDDVVALFAGHPEGNVFPDDEDDLW